MKWSRYYRELPIKPKHLLVVSLLIILVFWGQGGFRFQLNYSLFLLANYFIWFLLLPVIQWLVIYTHDTANRKWMQVISWVIILISSQWILSNVVLSLLKYLIMNQPILEDWLNVESYLLSSILTRFFDLTLFFGLLYWIHRERLIAQKKVELAESQSIIHQSKLHSLKSQLNPHFLFNALHIINSQIGMNDKKAREMTLKISHLLRKLLAINQLEKHTVEEEMDFVKMYLDIEMERFSDRLSVHLDIDENAKSCETPTMVLQPLIENAFKHGISKIEGAAHLTISIKKDVKALTIQVKNPYPRKKAEESRQGIGLQNLEDRLKLYYANVQVNTSATDSEFVTRLILPA